MCGDYYTLPDGTTGQCNPDGDKPCCDDGAWAGLCGNTRDYSCDCQWCTDYKLLKDWERSEGKQRWVYDGRCGRKTQLPDGTPAECDPDGESPCCNAEYKGSCGNSTLHCSCSDCTDYKLKKDWEESGGTLKWRYDGNCGVKYPLPDGAISQCDPDGEKPCCSDGLLGQCGKTKLHCHCKNCTDCKFLKDWEESGGALKWRYDRKCGSQIPLPNGAPSICNPDGDYPCCSSISDGECGNTTQHCSCEGCFDYGRFYREWIESSGDQKWRYDGLCGTANLLPDGSPAQCDPDGEKPCCSQKRNGKCGNTTEFCACGECTDYKFAKWWRETEGKQKWRNDMWCGTLFPLPDGTHAQCNPDSETPCCSDIVFGRCGNTYNREVHL